MKDLISVVIPVYNTEVYLEKCVDSVLNQTYSQLEIIIVDDGSRLPAYKLCDELAKRDARIKVIHKKNGGLSSARNAGIVTSTGEFITFLDSDDYVSPTMYEELHRVASVDTIGVSHFVRVDESGKIYPHKDPHINGGVVSAHDYMEELLSHTGDVSTCTKLFHRTLIGEIRFDENKLNEDLLFMIRVLENVNTLVFTDSVGYYYLSRTDSISSKYGKAIEDMVGNSIVTKEFTLRKFPDLEEKAWRFTLYQHMAYLLMIPAQFRKSTNTVYVDAISFMRNNFLRKGLTNNKLKYKQKGIMLGLCICPEFMAKLFQKKH